MSTSTVDPDPNATQAQRIRTNSARRRERRRDELRQAILETATELVVQNGYEAFSLRKVAERIGYSPAAIYLHFADKDELLLEVLIDGYSQFNREMTTAAAAVSDPLEKVHQLGMTYIAFGMRHTALFKVMFMDRTDFLATAPPERIAFFTEVIVLMRDVISQCVAAGRFQPIDPGEAFDMLWALAHGQVALAICFQKPIEVVMPEAERALRIMAAGLARAGGA